MKPINYQTAVKEAARPKFRGRKTIRSRAIPMYPDSAEREYRRLNRAYVRMTAKVLKKYLPEIMEAYKREIRKDSREDGISDFLEFLRGIFSKAGKEIRETGKKLDPREFVKKISRRAQKNANDQWKKMVEKTTGIELLEEYYEGDTFENLVQEWVKENVSMITTIPEDMLSEMQEIIANGYRDGKTLTQRRDEIQKAFNVSKSKAESLARDQISTLNSQITKMQHEDAGVKKYEWSSCKDSRVRECHRAFDGKTFSWDNPPEAWYSTKSRGIVYTGRRCHPGEDYCCRCIAIPIFDIETLNLPMKRVRTISVR